MCYNSSMYRLHFVHDTVHREPFQTDSGPVLIGRADDCAVILRDNGVSDHHALIEHKADGYHIRDLGSVTGVIVNNDKIGTHRLCSGDIIELGAARMRFEVWHVVPSMRRRISPMQLAMILVTALTIAGQLGLYAWIVSQPRPAKIRKPTGREQVATRNEPSQAELIAPLAPVSPQPLEPSPPPATPPPAAPAVLNRKLRILSVEPRNTETTAGLTIRVMAQAGERQLDSGAAKVSVEFHVRADTGGVTLAGNAPVWLDTSNWENFTARTFQAQVAVPPTRLAGYVVRTYYRDELQDIAGTPGLVPAITDSLR